jgi:hypothetical protein
MPADCIFCRIAAGTAPASIVAQTPDTLAFMDINQPTSGHVLVIPRLHVQDIYELDDGLAASVFKLTVSPAISATAIASGLAGNPTFLPATSWIAWPQRSGRPSEPASPTCRFPYEADRHAAASGRANRLCLPGRGSSCRRGEWFAAG